MTQIRLSAISFDDIAFRDARTSGDSFEEPGLGLEYVPVTRLRSPSASVSALLPIDEFNQTIKSIAELSFAHTPVFSSGIAIHWNWSTYGPNSTPLNLEDRVILYGHRWGGGVLDYLKWHMSSFANATWNDSWVEFELEMTQGQSGEAWSLGCPGVGIFGHWILDLIPRMHLISIYEQRTGLKPPIVMPELPRWANYFFNAAGLSLERIRQLPSGVATTHHRLLAPTFPKIGYTLDLDLCRSAWRSWKARAQFGQRSFGHRKLWLSRSRWPVRREIVNEGAIEELLASLGYAIVHPQDLSLAEQATLFRDARVIIGQDGSALHNIIFCEYGAALGVIGLRERRNLWHLSMCEALEHHVCYMECDQNGVADLATLRELASALEHAAGLH